MNKKPSTTQQGDTPEPKHEQSIGRKLTYIGTVVLLILVVVTFVGAPALTGVASGNRLVFGTYADAEIIYSPGNFMAREFDSIARQVQEQQQQVTDLLVRQIWREAFQRAVFHEAMLHQARNVGVRVSERAVDRAVAQWPEFQVDGRFSAREFENTSTQQRFELRQYLRARLVSATVQSDLRVPSSAAEREFIIAMSGPERKFSFVQLGFSDYPRSEVVSYARANTELFQRAGLSVITVSSRRADADAIRRQAVERVASFEDLARNQSVDSYATDGGDMGSVYFHELELDFENPDSVRQVFALGAGEISPVLETGFGWAIYRMNETPLEPDFSDDGLVADIRSYLGVFERGLIEDYLIDAAGSFAASARETGFAAAAAALNQTPVQTEWFPINYGNLPFFGAVEAAANPALSAGANRTEFFTNLFRLPVGGVSDPILIRDYVFVLQLDEERETDPDLLGYLSFVAPQIVQQIENVEIGRTMVDPSLLVDNFTETYNRMMR